VIGCAEHAEKAMNEIRTSEPTPEQLLQVLESELAMHRARRQRSSTNRTAWRVGGVLLILGGAIAALLILQYAMSEIALREPGGRRSMQTNVRPERNF
jgi:hypothetical protein